MTEQHGLKQLYANVEAERDRLRAEKDALATALEKIAEVCNGYGNEAGWACKTARAAIAKAKEA